jgi:hypothetical protein
MMSLKKSLLVAVFTTLLPSLAFAVVSKENGTLSFTHKDKASTQMLDRFYDGSKEIEGLFGLGWSTIFDTHLYALHDGSVVINEGGDTRYSYYVPKEFKKDALEKALKLKDPEFKVESLFGNGQKTFETSLKLKSFANKDSIEKSISSFCGEKSLEVTKNGYKRLDCRENGAKQSYTDTFDAEGRLTKREFEDGTKFTVKWGDKIVQVIGKYNLDFYLNAKKHVDYINTKTYGPTYTYTGSGMLESVGKGDNRNTYDYSEDGNLTSFVPNKGNGSFFVEYYPASNQVKTFTAGDNVEEYVYNRLSDAQTETIVTMKSGDTAASVIYSHLQKEGMVYESKTMKDKDGRVYFASDFDGRYLKISYNDKFPTLISKLESKDFTSIFQYDDEQNLTHYSPKNGVDLHLNYANKKISQIDFTSIDQGLNEKLVFSTNADDMHKTVELSGVGTIFMKKNESGQFELLKEDGIKLLSGVKEGAEMESFKKRLQTVVLLVNQAFMTIARDPAL